MSLRQRQWANRAKAQLIASMGGCCWACGATHALEVDHIDPAQKRYRTNACEFSWRVSRYRAEWKAGAVQLLCEACNQQHGGRRKHAFAPPEGVVVGRLVPMESVARSENEPF